MQHKTLNTSQMAFACEEFLDHLETKYPNRHNENYTLITRIFICMCISGKKVTTYQTAECFGFSSTTFSRLHSPSDYGAKTPLTIEKALHACLITHATYELAFDFMFVAGFALPGPRNSKLRFYDYLLKKYCENQSMDVMTKIERINGELECNGYPLIRLTKSDAPK